MHVSSYRVAPILAAWTVSCAALAAGGPLGIDHRLPLDESGIWSRSNQRAVEGISADVDSAPQSRCRPQSRTATTSKKAAPRAASNLAFEKGLASE